MKEPISIKEILAIVIKRGIAVICVAVMLAALLGGFQGFRKLQAVRAPSNSAAEVDKRNNKAMAEYNAQTAALQCAIETVNYKIEKQREYNENSLLMQLDPYNKYTSNIVLAITELEENAFLQVYKIQGTPVDYIVSKMVQQYVVYWENMELSTLKNNPFEGEEEKYVRELVSVAKEDGGTIAITANAATAEEAEAMCKSVYEAILAVQPTIADATYSHGLSVISNSTKMIVDYDLDKDQIICMENLAEYMEELEDYQAQLKKVKKPGTEKALTMSDVVGTAVKWAVIGGVVGFVLACGCVWLVYIVSDGVETTRQMEAIVQVPFFGSSAKKGSAFVRLANWFVGERSWNDRNRAVAYIAENLKSRLDAPGKIAVVSTLKVTREDAGIALVLSALEQLGHKVCFVNEAEQNPEAIAALRENDYVLQAERLGASNRNAMLCVLDQAKRLDAQVLGFITI